MIRRSFLKRINYRDDAEIRAYTMLILSLFSLIFFGAFAIRPSVIVAMKLREEVSVSENLDKKLSEKIIMLLEAEESYEKIKPFQELIDRAMPESKNESGFLERISLLGAKSGVSITRVILQKQKTAEPNKHLKYIPFVLTVSGEYNSLGSFIKSLQTSVRTIEITSTEIEIRDFLKGGRKIGKSKASVKGRIYYLERETLYEK